MEIRRDAKLQKAGARGSGRRRPVVRLSTLLLTAILLVSCDGLSDLLEADLPGQVTDDALNAPELAETLVAGAQANFECGFQGHVFAIDAGWANAFQYVIFQIEMIRIANRDNRVVEHVTGECQSNRDPIWFNMHRARNQAADAATRITSMPEGSVDDVEYLLGKAYAYEGYATELLAEGWCEMVFDGSEDVVSRPDALEVAEDRFSKALTHATAALAQTPGAQDIVDLALVGRARSRLNQGDLAGALSDASAVSEGFTYFATYDAAPSRRQNMYNNLRNGFVLHPRFREASIDGIPDPRIPSEMIGQHLSGMDWWVQSKYPDPAADIPFASWREAQLMIAELEGGQTAVEIINNLRATVSDLPYVPTGDYELPMFESDDEAEILEQVYRERERELFLQGTKLGDDLRSGRWATEWDTGASPVNAPIGDNTCIPLPEIEFL